MKLINILRCLYMNIAEEKHKSHFKTQYIVDQFHVTKILLMFDFIFIFAL